MNPIARINIFQHRIGDAPDGYWRYVYDAYPEGKPVEEASAAQGRAAFSAYRTQAPDTVAIYRHRYAHDEPSAWRLLHLPQNQRTPSSYELSEHPPASNDKPPTGSVNGRLYASSGDRYAGSAPRRSDVSTRAFWAFPASHDGDMRGAVPVYEHRLEIDALTDFEGAGPFSVRDLICRYATYIKYDTNENAGRVFDDCADAREPSPSSGAWWRTTAPAVERYGQPDQSILAYARYTRKIAFHAFPPQ